MMDTELLGFLTRLALFFGPFLFSLCFHEYAHGLVAKWRGDRTAELMGRLTLNPIAHMDLIGTLILPILGIITNSPIFFGWAKPVPVNSRNLKNPRADMFWVALAGPLSNIILAFFGTFILVAFFTYFKTTDYFSAVMQLLKVFIQLNLFLAFFNLIPLHPLDGGKILARFLPAQWNYKLEQNESVSGLILMFLILSGALTYLALPVQKTANFMIFLATEFFY